MDEFEYAITLTQNTVPCGAVTFNVHDTGKQPFDFTIRGLPTAQGKLIDLGTSTSMTVTLAPGTYGYECNACDHHFEMNGVLSVVG